MLKDASTICNSWNIYNITCQCVFSYTVQSKRGLKCRLKKTCNTFIKKKLTSQQLQSIAGIWAINFSKILLNFALHLLLYLNVHFLKHYLPIKIIKMLFIVTFLFLYCQVAGKYIRMMRSNIRLLESKLHFLLFYYFSYHQFIFLCVLYLSLIFYVYISVSYYLFIFYVIFYWLFPITTSNSIGQ